MLNSGSQWYIIAAAAVGGAMVLGIMRSLMRRQGSHTPLGNFSSKRGNKNFYKSRGGNKYGIPGNKGGFILRAFPDFHMPDLADFKLKAYVMPGGGMIKPNVLEEGAAAKLNPGTGS